MQIPPDILTNPEAFKKFQEVQGQLSGALGRLLAVSRPHPFCVTSGRHAGGLRHQHYSNPSGARLNANIAASLAISKRRGAL